MRSTGVQWPEKMNRRTVISLLLPFSLLAVALPAAEKKPISDDAIYDNLRRKLANDPDVKGGALDVQVKDGIVTLRGTVEYDKQKSKAEKLARKVNGVKRVNNELTVARKGAK